MEAGGSSGKRKPGNCLTYTLTTFELENKSNLENKI